MTIDPSDHSTVASNTGGESAGNQDSEITSLLTFRSPFSHTFLSWLAVLYKEEENLEEENQ